MTISYFFKCSKFWQNIAIVNAVGIDAWPSKKFQHTSIVIIPLIISIGILLDKINLRIAFTLLIIIGVMIHFLLKKWANRIRQKYSYTITENYKLISEAYNYYLLVYIFLWAIIIGIEVFLISYLCK